MLKNKILLLFLFLSIGIANGQSSKMDSLKRVVETTTDSMFLEDWALNIHSKKDFGKFEKEEIVEWFIKRSGELEYPVIQAHFIFRKSIQKTINGDYDAALKLIEQIIPVFKKYEDVKLLSACYNSKGSTLATIGEIPEAIANLENAIALMENAIMDPKTKMRSMANHYNVLGTIYNRDSQYIKSINNYEKAYDFALKGTLEGSKERCFCLLNLAAGKIKLKEYDKALMYSKMSIKQSLIGKYNDTYCMGLQRLGLVYSGLNQKDSALHYYNLMEKVAFENKYNHYLYQAYKVQADHYEKHGQIKLALEKQKLYCKLVIQREKEKKKALSNHMISETKKRDKVKAELELSKKIQEEKIKQSNLKIFIFSLIGIMAFLGALFYSKFQRRKLKQRLKDKRNQLDLMHSQIKTIGSQMNPHFVFNALNSVQDLIMQKDIRNSNIYLGKFADLMRKTLEASESQTITLDKEIEILNLYLELESLRFDRDFSFLIEKIELKNVSYKLPAMLLQPYVENAVKHGLLHKKGAKELRIIFSEIGNKLECIIKDNGVGRIKSGQINLRREPKHNSFSSQANQKRLDLINQTSKNKVNLEIVDLYNGNEPAGTKVIFSFTQDF